MNDYKRLLQQVGNKFNYNSLECCLLDEEEAGIEIDCINNNLYKIYYDIPDTNLYKVLIDDNNIIVNVEEV